MVMVVVERGDTTPRLQIPYPQQHHLRHRRRVTIQTPTHHPQLSLARADQGQWLREPPAQGLEANDLVGHHVRPRGVRTVVRQQRSQTLHVQTTVQEKPSCDLCNVRGWEEEEEGFRARPLIRRGIGCGGGDGGDSDGSSVVDGVAPEMG